MRLTTLAALQGAASVAVAEQQKVLSDPLAALQDAAGDWKKPLETFQEALKGMSDEARALWDEINLIIPGAFYKGSFFSPPKPHTRRPDGEWDYIVKGADVEGLKIQAADGSSQRKISGNLKNYNLRAKGVDPSKLGIDSVKQYSGYLDDNENDKHLFYCMLP